MAAQASAQEYLGEPFEKEIPREWSVGGDVKVVDAEKFSGEYSVKLARTRETFDVPTFLRSLDFAVKPGPAEFRGAFKAKLNSPDSSFNASIDIETLDSSGKVVDTVRVDPISGNTNWIAARKAFLISEKVEKARVRIQLNKAVGQLWVDDLSLVASAHAAMSQSSIKRLEIKATQTGALFYPDQPASFDIRVIANKELPETVRAVSYLVTDYWGGEQTEVVRKSLEKGDTVDGAFQYTRRIDLSGFTPAVGKYYELRVVVDDGTGDPVREVSGFAQLPEAPAKKYSWRDVPFSSRNWDNRMPPYFELTDRLGIRLAGVWGMWEAQPPYEPSAPGFDVVKKLGLTMLTRTPIVEVEHHRKGFEAYNEKVIREGVGPFFQKFGQDGEIVVTLGNEPLSTGPTVEENVQLYKAAYEQVKKISPGTFVVGTSVGPAEEYFKLGFQKYSDAVDFHTYEDSRTMADIFARYKALFAKYGGEQPIWATEMGLNAQGLSRRVVAGELIKKFSWFFSYGGQNGSWFGICYPDRQGKLRGTAEDAFNVFDGLYGNFSPRLDAIAYYNVVNGICIKKFVAHRVYGEDLHAFLFLDRNGENLQVLWKDHGAEDVAIPLSSDGEAKVMWIDGTISNLASKDAAVSLRVGEDPVMLSYHGSQKELPGKLGSPAFSVKGYPKEIVRGQTAKIVLEPRGTPVRDIKVEVPPGWTAGASVEIGDGAEVEISGPVNTDARFVPVRLFSPAADLGLVIPVKGQISGELVPVSIDGKPAVVLVLKNNSNQPESVGWKMSLLKQIAPNGGLYTLTAAKPAEAYFADATDGNVTVDAQGEARVRVPLAGVDPLTSYKVRGVISDASGRAIELERYVGGFVTVPKVREALKLNGSLDDADWDRAVPQKLDRESQVRHLGASSKWTGTDDLSGEVRFLWDDSYLYVGVKVKDDVFRNQADGSAIWAGDGLQFLIDPARSQKDKPGKYDYALGVGKNGPVAWCYLSADGKAPAGEVKDFVFSESVASDGGGSMIYEVGIPWSRLAPFKPGPGGNLGMAVILNEDDAPKRDGFMTWFGDIQSKEVDVVGDLILQD